MTVVSISKFHMAISLEANESLDTEFFAPDTGQVKLKPSYYTSAGTLQASGNDSDWIAIATAQNTLFDDSLMYPRYIRPTAAATIYFNVNS